MSLAQRVLDGLGEGFRDYAGDLLPGLVAALVADAEVIGELVGGSDGWASGFDLTRTRNPAWLGQLAGVAAVGGTLQAQRDRVMARGYTRGTPAAIRAAAASTLTKTRTVDVLERQGDAYTLLVRSYFAETPDPAATAAAVAAVLPAGIILLTAVLSGETWADVAASGATWQSLLDNGSTWDDLRLAVPSTTGTQTWGAAQRGNWETAYDRTWAKLRKPTAPNPATTTVTTWSHATTTTWDGAQIRETWTTLQQED